MADKESLTLPALLVIMDGYGHAPATPCNAIKLADTPNLDKLYETCSWTELDASGVPVGLPNGQMGNSEVGHLNIGAGRTIFQELTRIDLACEDGSLEANEVLRKACQDAIDNDSTLHFMGLLSDGGVHSSNQHLYALLKMAAGRGVKKIRVHCFMDGRDVSPTSGKGFVAELEQKIAELPEDVDCKIGVISGRYYAMDRDKRWDRVEKAWRSIWHGEAKSDLAPVDAMQASYDAGVTDEFVVPVSLNGYEGATDKDSFVFFNFRPDRARQMSRAICDPEFDGFERDGWGVPSFTCLTEYDPTIPAPIAFEKEFPEHVLADVISENGLKQFHIAETEKYAHVTFFLNGGVEEPKPGETRKLIPSPKVATYDLQPEMSEPEVATTLRDAILADEADVYIVNFANCDMVGHTGFIPAAKAAVEAVDTGIGMVMDALEQKGGVGLVTADHGNADQMRAEDGSPFTQHTTNLVPLILVDFAGKGYKLKQERGCLANISPTLLEMIGLDVPFEMTAKSLLEK